MRLLKTILPAAFILFTVSSCDKDAEFDPKNVTAVDSINIGNMITEVNKFRSSGCNCGSEAYPPVPALVWNSALETAAVVHAMDMNGAKNLSHTGSDGSDVGVRVTNQGYVWSAVGENIAQGPTTEQQVVQGWIASPEHCKNIMNATFTEMGAARSGTYWAQVLAKP